MNGCVHRLKGIHRMHELLSKHWYSLPTPEVLEILESDPEKGLDRFEIQHRLKRFGHNRITPRRGTSPLIRFLLQFKNPLIIVLLISSAITILIKDPVDALIILAVVLINAVIGFIQESKAEKAIEALAQSMTTNAIVIRAGQKQQISAEELVPGDIVLLQAGDKTPADIRLIRTKDFQVAEAALTGESVPIQKNADERLGVGAVLGDRKTMAFASTYVTFGQATGVVTATGDATEVGRISELIAGAANLETPLTRKIAAFSHIIMYAVLGVAFLTFVVGVLRGAPVVDTFTAAVALTVAMIPEGLPVALTVALAIGVSRMARRRAIIRKLPAVETLGSVSVICSDKTGTLTQNQMTTQFIHAGGRRFSVSGKGYDPSGAIRTETHQDHLPAPGTALHECLLAGLLCNDSMLAEKEGSWIAQGDPTEVALIVAARRGGVNRSQDEYQRIDSIPFDSEYQFMATLHTVQDVEGRDKTHRIYLKGAVEVLLDRCRVALGDQGTLEPVDRDAIMRDVDVLANDGLRVLAFAFKPVSADRKTLSMQDVGSDLVFLGLQAIIDPPREEVIDAIRACRSAGIRVKMITGDHALTASAIATRIGLADPCPDKENPASCTLTGRQIAERTDEELIRDASRTAVFARVSPEQKLRLVEALQADDEIVAMTGDGVNDGPALKQANIGIAMGITGTEVAKEAADMVLTDDNFSTIAAAVEEGRVVFDNLTKIIVWTLPTNVGEGLILFIAILFGIALPILPVQILWVNTVTAVALGLVLAMEPKEPGIMTRPPRKVGAPILTPELSARILLVGFCILLGTFGLYELDLMHHQDPVHARTVAVNVIVMIEIFYLFNCRSFIYSVFRIGFMSNRWAIAGTVFMIFLQLLFTYLPFMNRLFQTSPIRPMDWIWILVVSVAAYVVVEIEKWIRRRLST